MKIVKTCLVKHHEYKSSEWNYFSKVTKPTKAQTCDAVLKIPMALSIA